MGWYKYGLVGRSRFGHSGVNLPKKPGLRLPKGQTFQEHGSISLEINFQEGPAESVEVREFLMQASWQVGRIRELLEGASKSRIP